MMSHARLLPALVAAAVLLGGCMHNPPQPPKMYCHQEGVVFLNKSEILLCYFEAVQSLQGRERDDELRVRKQILSYTGDPVDRLRVVILLALSDNDPVSLEKALAYMDPPPANLQDDAALANFARLMQALIRQKLAYLNETVELRTLLDAETRRADANKELIAKLNQSLKEQREQTRMLEEQLNALKEIENSIGARKRAETQPVPEN